jgi:hypothetical protein
MSMKHLPRSKLLVDSMIQRLSMQLRQSLFAYSPPAQTTVTTRRSFVSVSRNDGNVVGAASPQQPQLQPSLSKVGKVFLRRSKERTSLPTNTNIMTNHPQLGPIPSQAGRWGKLSSSSYGQSMHWIRAGLPLILFSILSAWVVSNAYGGKLRELEASQGKSSISIRQAALEEEHQEMMERLSKIVATDYDNTKRIKRPEEVLEERRLERQKRNAWHRRFYRWISNQSDDRPKE